MADREKVIRGLECCIPMTLRNGLGDCGNCPYDREITIDGGLTECCHDLMTDALTLLKAQEPRAPHYTRLEYIVDGMPVVVNHPECPRCYENGLLLWDAAIEKGVRFCKRCGQEVKWE